MKFTLSWLKQHLDTTASVDAITEALTDLGLEVEEVKNPADILAPFTIGFVADAQPHPNADRLRVCKVDTDDGQKQIICGAPNARAGIYVVVAKPGVYVPGIDTTIGVGKIRGVESFGMMASEKEMQLSDEHDGIIELPNTPKIGTSFAEYLATHDPDKIDPMIEIAITPNRSDALGVRGIARDLATRGLGKLKPEPTAKITDSFTSQIKIHIEKNTLNACPIFAGRLIKGVKNPPSPAWLQARLRAIGLRPISTLVDITNLFTYEYNRPLHVFDADKIKGDLRIHLASGGETITALDEKDYTLHKDMVAISDDAGVQSIAGIMGGFNTGCQSDTVNVFLESAYWDAITIARTGRALKIQSDARYRFERGIDPEFTVKGLDLATEMILDLCGGQASAVVMDGQIPDTKRFFEWDAGRVKSLVGMDVSADRQRDILQSLGFEIKSSRATVPSWRPDILDSADLVEEVARVVSLSQLEPTPLPPVSKGVSQVRLSPSLMRENHARRATAALGYLECITYSFIDKPSAEAFGGGSDAVRLSNPISADMSHLRPSLLPGLLQAAARNSARGMIDMALFELGPVFHGGEPEDEEILLCGILVGHGGPRNPHAGRRLVDVYDAKADVAAVLSAIGAPAKQMVLRGASDWWHPGRSGKLALGPKNSLCAFGEIHPRILADFGLKTAVVGFALHLDRVPFSTAKTKTRPALHLTDLQAIERDFAFIVDEEVEAVVLLNAAKGADKAFITEAFVFDVFSGKKAQDQMGTGKKSVALSVRIQPKDGNLTDADLEAISAAVVKKVSAATGAVLRG